MRYILASPGLVTCRRRLLGSNVRLRTMAFGEIEEARIRKLLSEWLERRRPPPHIRPQLDLAYRVSGQSIELFEVRPVWRGKPGERAERAVAKATYVKAQEQWRIYWRRADLKWHRYEPYPSASSVQHFLSVVDADQYACFFG
jgi:hypothetical protein